jgi:hypothetical protein
MDHGEPAFQRLGGGRFHHGLVGAGDRPYRRFELARTHVACRDVDQVARKPHSVRLGEEPPAIGALGADQGSGRIGLFSVAVEGIGFEQPAERGKVRLWELAFQTVGALRQRASQFSRKKRIVAGGVIAQPEEHAGDRAILVREDQRASPLAGEAVRLRGGRVLAAQGA